MGDLADDAMFRRGFSEELSASGVFVFGCDVLGACLPHPIVFFSASRSPAVPGHFLTHRMRIQAIYPFRRLWAPLCAIFLFLRPLLLSGRPSTSIATACRSSLFSSSLADCVALSVGLLCGNNSIRPPFSMVVVICFCTCPGGGVNI